MQLDVLRIANTRYTKVAYVRIHRKTVAIKFFLRTHLYNAGIHMQRLGGCERAIVFYDGNAIRENARMSVVASVDPQANVGPL